MIAREQPANSRAFKDCGRKFRNDLAGQQPIAVPGKGRVAPNRLIGAEPHDQRKSRSNPSPSLSCRSERTEWKACSSISGAIDGRPTPE